MLKNLHLTPKLKFFTFKSAPSFGFLKYAKNIKHTRTLYQQIFKYNFSSRNSPIKPGHQELRNSSTESLKGLDLNDVLTKSQNTKSSFQAKDVVKITLLLGQAENLALQREVDKAIACLNQAQELINALDPIEHPDLIRMHNFQIAGTYYQLGKLDESLKCIEKTLELQKNARNKEKNLCGLMQLTAGKILREKKDFTNAKNYFLQAKDSFEQETNCTQWLSFNFEFGKLLVEKEEYPEALKYLQKANETLEKEEKASNILKAEVCFYLSRAYEGVNEIDDALRGYLRVYDLKDENFPTKYEKSLMIELLERVMQRLIVIQNMK